MKIPIYAVLTASVCLCTSLAQAQVNPAQLDYGRLLTYTTQQTAHGMTTGLTTVKLSGSELNAVPTCDVKTVGAVQTYTQTLTQGTMSGPLRPIGPGGTRQSDAASSPATASIQCGYLTLPTNCDTQNNACFSQSSGPCTKTGICNTQASWPACTVYPGAACGQPLTLPPLCSPLTSVKNCTQGASDCGALTLYPACTTMSDANCLTLSGDNCSTKNWFCQQATLAPACSGGPPTFVSGGSCNPTYNWDCLNTSNDLCSTKATGCAATKGVGCIRTFAPQCLTYKGSLCPNGPPLPAPIQSQFVILVLSIAVCGAAVVKGRD